MIEIGSKWQHKDGGVYEVIDCREQNPYVFVYEFERVEMPEVNQ